MITLARIRNRIIGAVMAALSSFLFVGCLSGCTKTVDWEYIEQRGKIIVGLDEEYPPFSYRNKLGELVGFDIDLAIAVGNKLGVGIKFKPIEWTKKSEMLKEKKIDMIWSGMTITDERKKEMLFTTPYIEANTVLMTRADSEFIGFADLEGKKIGAQEGASHIEWLTKNNFNASNIVTKPNLMGLTKNALLRGEVDAIIMDNTFAEYYMTHFNADNKVKALTEVLAEEMCGVGVRLSDGELCEKVNTIINQFKTDGTMALISSKWFGDGGTVAIA